MPRDGRRDIEASRGEDSSENSNGTKHNNHGIYRTRTLMSGNRVRCEAQ